MSGGYKTPERDAIEELLGAVRALRLRVEELERPTGTQLVNAVAKVRALIDDLQTEIDNLLAVSVNTGDVNATGHGHFGTDVSAGGPIYSPHGRATPVTSGYIGAWLNVDGRIGASASSLRFKQDIQPADTTAEVEALLTIGLVRYRYIEDVEEFGNDAPWHLGSLAEYMAETALREWVPSDQDGEPFAINWEHLIIPAIATLQRLHAEQKLDRLHQDGLAERVRALESLVADGHSTNSGS